MPKTPLAELNDLLAQLCDQQTVKRLFLAMPYNQEHRDLALEIDWTNHRRQLAFDVIDLVRRHGQLPQLFGALVDEFPAGESNQQILASAERLSIVLGTPVEGQNALRLVQAADR